MTSEALFDLPPALVKRDATRGHITLAANPFGQCDGAFVDLGAALHWWSQTALHLDVVGARTLGEHLIAWADKRDGRAR